MSAASSHASPSPALAGPPPTDDSLAVAAMSRGETGGLSTLYTRYAAIMLATARRILGDPLGAEDVVHDVFLEAWRQAATYDPTRGSVRTWLFVRLRSRALDRYRAAALRRTVRDIPELSTGEDTSELPDHHLVRAVLATLPPDQRAVLEAAYFNGLSASEIAADFEIPIGTVKSRLGAGLKKLRAALSAGTKERP